MHLDSLSGQRYGLQPMILFDVFFEWIQIARVLPYKTAEWSVYCAPAAAKIKHNFGNVRVQIR